MKIENGLMKETPPDPRMGTATMTSGSAVVYLTDDGTATGNALLGSVVGAIAWINSKNNAYPCEAVLSNSNRTLTIGANQQGTTSANALITLLGALGSFLTGVTYNPVPNGTVVNYFILATLN